MRMRQTPIRDVSVRHPLEMCLSDTHYRCVCQTPITDVCASDAHYRCVCFTPIPALSVIHPPPPPLPLTEPNALNLRDVVLDPDIRIEDLLMVFDSECARSQNFQNFCYWLGPVRRYGV
jgi:hypothetical protein